MRRYTKLSTLFLVCFSILSIIETGCAGRPFMKPPGERLGSCRGVMKMENSQKTRFKVDLYKDSAGDLNFYLTMIRKGVRHALIEDISLDDESISIELASSRKKYVGTIAGDNLKFDGAWGGFSGAFKLKLDK